jgi:hypothetical protein
MADFRKQTSGVIYAAKRFQIMYKMNGEKLFTYWGIAFDALSDEKKE